MKLKHITLSVHDFNHTWYSNEHYIDLKGPYFDGPCIIRCGDNRRIDAIAMDYDGDAVSAEIVGRWVD